VGLGKIGSRRAAELLTDFEFTDALPFPISSIGQTEELQMPVTTQDNEMQMPAGEDSSQLFGPGRGLH
jgi:hypothetical protein